MKYIIENDKLKCVIDSKGAELKSIYDKESGTEYLWNGNPDFWNRCSPVLFPFVGGVKNKEYRHDGQTFTINQHGFARDMEFELIKSDDEEVWFSLSENEETISKYPFKFALGIGYKLSESAVKVLWRVKNTNDKKMYFAIGAHPGFNVPMTADENIDGFKHKGYAFKLFDKDGAPADFIINRIFGGGGCVTDKTENIATPSGILPLTENLFDGDALVIENSQLTKVMLGKLNADKNDIDVSFPNLSVAFTAPLVGLWSPPHKNVPFVCIEPWYGRCDSESFIGELKERDYEQEINAGDEFNAEYEIEIN